ncbi:hypothetical protein BEL04_12800 [Mucilaginibacter sp. PPCGB 2223]|uniref:hypothetical protein n=1 Tax=Mucilaginibacter sp. PPCGB 2223 TaxID=1886027 RepID=UPI0008242160|nr:hypothetical protein [Mucilaginibacter sp. PPCGB 2223]OCX52343.1 hypothetical protein BEL04_12800 [Mucilaginibacter sp. PPCGB 2223]
MKKQLLFTVVLALVSVSSFAKWHQADLYYTNGNISRSEIQLPDETFSGIFNREIIIKTNTENDEHVSLKDISKVILTDGIVLVKYDNHGKPVLLKQITSYPVANILVLEKHGELGSNNYWSYIYSYGNSNHFYNTPPEGYRQDSGYEVAGLQQSENSFFTAGYRIEHPTGYYYSTMARNGRLYTPDKEDYIYLLKDNKIERLLPSNIYAKLGEMLGDDPAVAKVIKNGLSNYFQLNELVAVYNADKKTE